MLKNKKILLGVSGSIAAYKTAFLIRLLVKEGAEVRVIMTHSAKDFITPLTLSTLSKNPVLSEFYTTSDGSWNNHVELGLWADIFLVAPASANTLAKMAHGICDNLLLATYLSAKCPVVYAPAMDLDMWRHPSTQNNIKQLEKYGNHQVAPNSGELASGLEGQGRMAEPEELVLALKSHLGSTQRFAGKKALVTAGPTYENIDPVRFIGNHSSGKMGFAIAEALANEGAQVTLVAGPSHLDVTHPKVKRINIVSADDLLKACVKEAPKQDIVVMSAAVADYKPENIASQKIKKKDMIFLLKLKKTTDILKELGSKKTRKQTFVGFALETNNELKNAKDKLKNKNLDLIVLNSMKDKGAGFSGDSNKVTIIDAAGEVTNYPLKSKQDVARDILDKIDEIKHA